MSVRDRMKTHPLVIGICHAMKYADFERSGDGALYSYLLHASR